MFQTFYSCEKSISRKKSGTSVPTEKSPSLVLPRNAIMLQHLITDMKKLLDSNWPRARAVEVQHQCKKS